MMTSTDGLKYIITATPADNTIPLPTKSNSEFIYSDTDNKRMKNVAGYLSSATGTTPVSVFQITPLVFYDIANGNIILKSDTTTNAILKIYDRAGGEKPNPANTGRSSQLTGGPISFTIGNDKSGMVLVTSYNQNTIISVIISDKTADTYAYKIVATQRFNKTQAVNDLASDPDNAAPTTAPATTAPATTAPATTAPAGSWDTWRDQYQGKMNCGSDKNCWYWFFKSLPSFKDQNDMSDIYDGNNGQSFFSDDYFLKTEVVPPVCPKCPNCPESGTGTCTSCGGNGGSGTNINSCSSVSLQLTPITTNTYKDNLGNVYIASTDTSGNTRYILQGTGTSTTAANNAGTSAASLDNNISGVANNVINTAGGVVGTAGNLAYSAGSGGVNLLKDTGSGAVNLLKDTGSGAVNLLKDTGSGAINLLKDAGSGIAHLGSGSLQMQQGSQYNSTTGAGAGAGAGVGGGGGGASLASVSDKTFGKMSGQTPVDNYSYYGALQSKGGNFMPVTADFSSFRK